MSGRSSRSNRGSTDPLGDLLENLKQNPIPGLFSSSSTDNSVVLHDWWLATSCVEGGLKRLAISGYIAKKKSEAPFVSAPIVKRHDTFTLEAADGVTVKVEGMINQTNTQNNGFSHEVGLDVTDQHEGGLKLQPYITPTPGANTSQILEQLVPGVRNILNPNLAAADPIEIDDDTLGDSLGSSTPKEFEPAHEGNPVSSDNNMKAEAVVDLVKKDNTRLEKEDTTNKKGSNEPRRHSELKAHEGNQSSSDNYMKAKTVVNLEKEDTTSNKRSDAPRRSGRTKAHEGNPSSSDNYMKAKTVVNLEKEDATNLEKEDTTSNKRSDAPQRSGRTKAHEGNPSSSDNYMKAKTVVNLEKEDATNLEKEDTTSNKRSDAPRRSGRTKAHEGNPCSSNNYMKAKTVVNLEKEDTTSNKRSDAPRRSGRTKQHEDGLISTDGKEVEEFATPQKDDTLSDKKLPSAGRRKNAAAQSKAPDTSPTSVKGSSKKVHVLQSRDKTSDRGCRRANMEVHGATISPPLSESNIRRSRSGRVIIPTIDKGSQTVVYDQNGNFAGVSAVSTGSTSKPNRKKRRF